MVEAEKLVHDYPGLTTPLNLRAQILSHQGQAAKAIADAEAALRLATSQGPVGVILAQRRTKAIVLAALGRIGEAVNELQAVAEAGYAFGYNLRTNDDYDPLRQDPRFQKLMAAAEAQANAQPRSKK